MKYAALIAACVCLMLTLSNCAHARIQAEWELLRADEELHWETSLETDEYRLYLGHWEGLYISVDHGYTWRLTLPDRAIRSIAFGPNTVYAGTHYHGLFRSDTRGNTWQPKNDGFALVDNPHLLGKYSTIEQILVTRSGTVIANKYHSGVYISTNRGESWHDIYEDWHADIGARFGRNIWSMAEFGGYWFAATSSGLMLRSPDNGDTWKWTRHFKDGRMWDWEVFNDQLYAVTYDSFGRWNEGRRRLGVF